MDVEAKENSFPYQIRPRYVCLCKAVSQAQIEDAVLKQNAETFEKVQAITGCSTGCGTCEGRVRNLIEQILKKKGF